MTKLSSAADHGLPELILILCKSSAALIYGAVLVPLVRLTKPRLQLRVAMILVILALAYTQLLRATDLVPTNYIVRQQDTISEERAESP